MPRVHRWCRELAIERVCERSRGRLQRRFDLRTLMACQQNSCNRYRHDGRNDCPQDEQGKVARQTYRWPACTDSEPQMHQELCRLTLSRPRRTRANYLPAFRSQVTRPVECTSEFARLRNEVDSRIKKIRE